MKKIFAALGALAFLVSPAFAADDQPSEAELEAKAKKHLEAAKEYLSEHKYEDAISELKEAQDAAPRSADIYSYLGYAYRNIGKYETSFSNYQKALRYDADHIGAHEYLGELYLKMGQLDKALAQEAKLKELCPGGCAELDELKAAIEKYQSKS